MILVQIIRKITISVHKSYDYKQVQVILSQVKTLAEKMAHNILPIS